MLGHKAHGHAFNFTVIKRHAKVAAAQAASNTRVFCWSGHMARSVSMCKAIHQNHLAKASIESFTRNFLLRAPDRAVAAIDEIGLDSLDAAVLIAKRLHLFRPGIIAKVNLENIIPKLLDAFDT